MKELELAQSLLKEILEDKVSFLDALKKTFQAQVDLRIYRNVVAGLLGCELRHHILMEYLIKDIQGLSEEDKRYIFIGLANNYYYKHLDAAEVEKVVLSRFNEETAAAVKALFDKVATPDEIIPSEIDRESRLYLSLRYNAPEWAVKILLHYGNALAFRCLRKFSRPQVSTLRLRTSVVGKTALDNDPDFVPSIVDGVYCYKGNKSLRKNPLFREGKIFLEKMLIKTLVEQLRVEEPAEILLYNGNDDYAFELELLETYGKTIGMNFACPDVDAKLPVKKILKAEGYSNVNFFSANDPLFMDAHISRPQDLVFALPNSTNFDRIPETPDYLLRFDTGSMDALLKQEQDVLEGAAKHVDVHGKLVYCIFTLSKKEGKTTVSNFLKAHPEFSLLKQEEHFPFAKLETAAYVAIMEKTEEALTAPSPLTDLAPIPQSESYSASASSK